MDVQSYHSLSKEYRLIKEIENTSIKSISKSLEEVELGKSFGYFLCENAGEYFLMESFYEIEKRRMILDDVIKIKEIEEDKKRILKLRINRSN